MLSRSLEMGQALQLHKACIFVSFSQRHTPLPTFCRFSPFLCVTRVALKCICMRNTSKHSLQWLDGKLTDEARSPWWRASQKHGQSFPTNMYVFAPQSGGWLVD